MTDFDKIRAEAKEFEQVITISFKPPWRKPFYYDYPKTKKWRPPTLRAPLSRQELRYLIRTCTYS